MTLSRSAGAHSSIHVAVNERPSVQFKTQKVEKGSEGSEKFSKFPFLHSSKIENVLIVPQKRVKNYRFGGL